MVRVKHDAFNASYRLRYVTYSLQVKVRMTNKSGISGPLMNGKLYDNFRLKLNKAITFSRLIYADDKYACSICFLPVNFNQLLARVVSW